MVKWSNPARDDLRQIYEYIAKDSRFYAKKVMGEIIEKSEILNTYPRIGRVVPELSDDNVRELIVYSYRLIYQVSFNDEIEVLSLVHDKRNFSQA